MSFPFHTGLFYIFVIRRSQHEIFFGCVGVLYRNIAHGLSKVAKREREREREAASGTGGLVMEEKTNGFFLASRGVV